MLSYRLPQFIEFLSQHYNALYNHYAGRLTELFPSSQANENSLLIVHDATDNPAEDELIIKLWKRFSSAE